MKIKKCKTKNAESNKSLKSCIMEDTSDFAGDLLVETVCNIKELDDIFKIPRKSLLTGNIK